MTKEEIAATLKRLRLSCGMTQKEVAKKIERNQPIIGHWESGYSQPDANTLFSLCELYGTTVDEAFGFQKKNYDISREDYERVKKYHSLDNSGQKEVDHVLNRELERMKILDKANEALKRFKLDLEFNNGGDSEKTNTRIIQYYQKLASAGAGQIVFDAPPTDLIEIPDIPEYKKVNYAIGVNGRSMEPLYKDGDILLIEKEKDLNPGEIGIFMINGESFVKKLGGGELISLNKDYENIALTEDSRCMGRVIGKLSMD